MGKELIPTEYRDLVDIQNPRILVEALNLYGLKETSGAANTPMIMAMANECNVRGVYNADSIPWCGLGVGYCALKAGKPWEGQPKDMLWALNWRKWGTPQEKAMLGDIITFKRDGGGHVAIYVGEDHTHYHVMGFNQGDKACIIRISKDKARSISRSKWNTTQPSTVRPIIRSPTGAVFDDKG